MLRITLVALTCVCAGSLASADIRAKFSEGAPKDQFSFKNIGNCETGPITIDLDLSTSLAGLIFDVTASGAGVEVFQPLEIVSGQKQLVSTPKVVDGDNQISLEIKNLMASQSIAFTIDVDDTMGAREITVSGSEIKDARIQVEVASEIRSGSFQDNAVALIETPPCA